MALGPIAGALQAASLAAFLLVAAVPAGAQNKLPPTVAAVIDYQRILRDAKAARSIRDQVESRRKLYQDEIANEEQRLHEVDKELATQRSVLSAEAFAQKREAFEVEVAAVQRMAQERRRQLDQVAAAAAQRGAHGHDPGRGRAGRHAGASTWCCLRAASCCSRRRSTSRSTRWPRLDVKLPNVKVPDKVD